MIVDQFVLELITMVLCIGVCFGCAVDNLRVYLNLDEHEQRLEFAWVVRHYKYPAISQPGSS